MRKNLAVVFACIILAFIGSSVADGARDWLSSGYVVTGYYPAAVWGPTTYYYGYFDYAASDPWYRYVAGPYLNSWYWPSWYYRSYPVSYYRPAYWYGWPWTYSVYY